MRNPSVLIVDDEIQMRRLLRLGLESEGYKVFDASDGQEAIEEITKRRPELVVLDLNLPKVSGLEVLRKTRTWSRLPVIILSVRGEEKTKIEALDLGADDYLQKPFSIAELTARIRANLRRKSFEDRSESVLKIQHLEIRFESRTLLSHGKEVRLTATEWSLVELLARHLGKVLTHKQILREIWSPENESQSVYLRMYIVALRKKLEINPRMPKLIINEPGVGYRMKMEAS